MAPAVTRAFFWSVVVISLLIAVFKRLQMLAPPGFPLGEGGLFVLFSEAIVNGNFALPVTVVYGGVTIPFAYPPAGFYLAAGIAKTFGSDLFSVYYWLPLVLNMLAVPAFCFLAAQITRDRVILLCAAILYVQLPDSFVWQITGGGLPRSLGALSALIAVALAFRIHRSGGGTAPLLCGVLVGLAILSHLEWGIFAAIGVTLALLDGSIGRKTFVRLGAIGCTALLVILPWLAVVLARHGLDPFLSSSSASQWNLGAFLGKLLTAEMFGLLVWPAALGAIVTIRRGDWFLLAWAMLTMLLTPRMGASAGLAVPGALLAGHGLRAAAEFLDRFLRFLVRSSSRRSSMVTKASLFGVGFPVLCLLLIPSLVLATPLRWMYHSPRVLEQVDRPTREAMQWIRHGTEPNSRFVLLTDAVDWWADRIAEWFPYLTQRSSLTTAQGLEWAGPGIFVEKVDEIRLLKAVQQAAPGLTLPVVAGQYCAADYVAVFLPPDAPERIAFLRSGIFQPVFANGQATVFKRMRACRGAGAARI